MGLLIYQTWSYNKICIYLEWQLLNFDEVVDITKHTNKCLKNVQIFSVFTEKT